MTDPSHGTHERPIDLIVLVAGMHRSGTSAVAGTLHHLGVPAAGSLLPAQLENPRGYFESAAVMEFHDAFLASVGLDWASPRPMPADAIATRERQKWVRDLVALIRRDLLPTGRVFSVKDPRLCRLLPLWRAALAELGATPRALVTLRHPRAVAASLSEWRGMPEEQGLALWLAHVLEAERDTRDLVRAFVVYDDVLKDWQGEFARVVGQLDVRGRVDFARAGDDIDGFLSEALRHHIPTGVPQSINANSLVDRCWSALQPLLSEPHDPAAMSALDELRKEYRGARHASFSHEGLRPHAQEARSPAADDSRTAPEARALESLPDLQTLGEAEGGANVADASLSAKRSHLPLSRPFRRHFWTTTVLRWLKR